MKFSAQEEYGLRLLVQVALHSKPGSIAIPELAKLEELSEPHVAKLLMVLRRAGFISSIRGQLGGYVLAKAPETIVIADVLEALGGRLYDENFCVRHSGLSPICPHQENNCLVHDLWLDVQRAVDHVIKNRTLKDILDRKPGLVRLGSRPPEASSA